MIFQEKSGGIYEKYLQYIRDHSKQLNDLFRSTLELIPNGVMLCEVQSRKIRFANQEMHRILEGQQINQSLKGLKEQVAKFSQFEEYQPQRVNPRSQNKSHSLVNDGVNLLEFIQNACEQLKIKETESIFKRKIDAKMHLQVKCQFTSNKDQLLVVCTDITGMKEIEKQEKKMRATFFSSVAHELRTPLNSIIPIVTLITQILSQSNKMTDRVQKLLKIVKNSSLHLQSVIEDALDISRLENNKFQIFKEMFDIRQIVDEVGEIMKFQIEQKGLSQIIQIDTNVPQKVYSDCKRFKQVLFNLIGNAIKFTYEGHVNVILTFNSTTNKLTCHVEDTGLGIQQSDQLQLFKFFGTIAQTKDLNRGGMGLGLTISKMILQVMGGEISVNSQLGVCSTFTFSIPLDELDEPQHIAPAQPASGLVPNFLSSDSEPEDSSLDNYSSQITTNAQGEENFVVTESSPDYQFYKRVPTSISLTMAKISTRQPEHRANQSRLFVASQ
ncbi:hypothetical protein FGO68_gene11116 [Halteria grandinella]|uniref:histidine kinase n=1 Tax=Halteria grandinella TaxID=5974 RepID=A0A8J8NUW4_HALGN|nr:hypothetical protein FGO68_gene11116 [Halteria grandinella]